MPMKASSHQDVSSAIRFNSSLIANLPPRRTSRILVCPAHSNAAISRTSKEQFRRRKHPENTGYRYASNAETVIRGRRCPGRRPRIRFRQIPSQLLITFSAKAFQEHNALANRVIGAPPFASTRNGPQAYRRESAAQYVPRPRRTTVTAHDVGFSKMHRRHERHRPPLRSGGDHGGRAATSVCLRSCHKSRRV